MLYTRIIAKNKGASVRLIVHTSPAREWSGFFIFNNIPKRIAYSSYGYFVDQALGGP
jgi:hypothetical protein